MFAPAALSVPTPCPFTTVCPIRIRSFISICFRPIRSVRAVLTAIPLKLCPAKLLVLFNEHIDNFAPACPNPMKNILMNLKHQPADFLGISEVSIDKCYFQKFKNFLISYTTKAL